LSRLIARYSILQNGATVITSLIIYFQINYTIPLGNYYAIVPFVFGMKDAVWFEDKDEFVMSTATSDIALTPEGMANLRSYTFFAIAPEPPSYHKAQYTIAPNAAPTLVTTAATLGPPEADIAAPNMPPVIAADPWSQVLKRV
jgi:hypothetical protein